MKFEENLRRLCVPEWKSKYIKYGMLKDILKEFQKGNKNLKKDEVDPLATKTEPESFNSVEELRGPFFEVLKLECSAVDVFFCQEEVNMLQRWDELEQQLKALRLSENARRTRRSHHKGLRNRRETYYHDGLELEEDEAEKRKKGFGWSICIPSEAKLEKSMLMEVMEEFYRKLGMLASYQTLNREACRKIVKKHDKIAKLNTIKIFMKFVDTLSVFKSSKIQKLVRKAEVAYVDNFTKGNRSKAMDRLRVPNNVFLEIHWPTMRAGIMLGVFVAALCVVLFASRGLRDSASAVYEKHEGAIYIGLRGMFVFALYPILLAINVYNMGKAGVNYQLILSFKPRGALQKTGAALWERLLENGAFVLMVWVLSAVYFVHDTPTDDTLPLVLLFPFLALFIVAVNPVLLLRDRRVPWPFLVFGRLICAPFYHVVFEDFFVADQFTSLAGPLMDLEYVIWYLIRDYNGEDTTTNRLIWRACLSAVPAWTRFAQCLRRFRDQAPEDRAFYPHLMNAGKYSTTFFIVIFATLAKNSKSDTSSIEDDSRTIFFTTCWAFAIVANFTYSIYWDLHEDWGLFRKNKNHKFLRMHLLYPKWTYYLAIAYNIFGRIAGTAKLWLGFTDVIDSRHFSTALEIIEATRRFVWNHFRFENEHLNNCGLFRATRDIPMPFDVHIDYVHSRDIEEELTDILNAEGDEANIRPTADCEESEVDEGAAVPLLSRRSRVSEVFQDITQTNLQHAPVLNAAGRNGSILYQTEI